MCQNKLYGERTICAVQNELNLWTILYDLITLIMSESGVRLMKWAKHSQTTINGINNARQVCSFCSENNLSTQTTLWSVKVYSNTLHAFCLLVWGVVFVCLHFPGPITCTYMQFEKACTTQVCLQLTLILLHSLHKEVVIIIIEVLTFLKIIILEYTETL